MDLRGPFVAGAETCVGKYFSEMNSGTVSLGSCGMLGSFTSKNCGGASFPYISTPGISTYTSGSISGISISSSSGSASTSELAPTPGVYTPPMR